METNNRRERIRELALNFISRTGMIPADFAGRVGYSYSTMKYFLSGSSDANKTGTQIEKAILDFLENNPLTSPDEFTGKIYETGAVKAMRKVFKDLIARPCVHMIYAPPGSGKTDIARHLITEHNNSLCAAPTLFRVYCRARIKPRDLMRRISGSCGSIANASIERAIANLRHDFQGKRVAIYFDEAQHLSVDCFEVVRELLDESPRFSLCFAGSHELERVFTGFAGTLEQLERRISDKVHLPALTRDEAAGILRQELHEVAPKLDPALIQEQIDIATITVKGERKLQRYISIGRLMASAREARETLINMKLEAQHV